MSELSQSILEWVSGHLEDALRDLERLVNIDSPPDHKQGVDRVGKYMSAHLAELGFHIERLKRDGYGDQIIARNSATSWPRVLILGHLDTVHPVGSAAKRPFRVEGNLARGPGVADDRSGLIGLLWALRALVAAGLLSGLPQISVVLSSDEEANSTSSREVILREAGHSDIVVGIEPGRPQRLVTSRSGAGQYFIEVEGVEAHAGTNPRDGSNAIVELAYRAIRLHSLTDLETGDVVNVGTVSGGRWINLVPAFARAEVQTHFIRGGEQLHEKIADVLNGGVTVANTRVSWRGGVTHPAWEPNQQSERLRQFVEGIGNEIGIDLDRSIGGGAADCNFVAPLGVPVVDSIAPVGGNLHTEDEYLMVDTIPQRVALLALVLLRAREFRP